MIDRLRFFLVWYCLGMRIVWDGQADMRGRLQIGSDSWLHPHLNARPHVRQRTMRPNQPVAHCLVTVELRIHGVLPFSEITAADVGTLQTRYAQVYYVMRQQRNVVLVASMNHFLAVCFAPAASSSFRFVILTKAS